MTICTSTEVGAEPIPPRPGPGVPDFASCSLGIDCQTYLWIYRNSTKNSGDEENDDDVDKDVGVDDEEWDALQADIERPEAILEAKSKESHPVHAPYFPLVGSCYISYKPVLLNV